MGKKNNEVDKNAVEKVIVKARYWWFVLYPDSVPDNWLEFLQKTGLPFCVSPLHEYDVNPDGELKKPHYHVILCWSGPTTFSNVKKNITDPLGQPHPQYLMSVKGAYRYLTHQDNPEKYQYNDNDIRPYGGFNINDYAELTISDEDRIYDSLENIIFQNKISDLYQLIKFLDKDGLYELKSFIRRHTYYVEKLLSSLRNSNYFGSEEYKKDFGIDFETGEIIN